jgi:putative ABC transport system permease protein
LATRVLNSFLREDLVEEVSGDLEEKFYKTVRNESVFRAKVKYWYQVINYVRPFAFKKSESINMISPAIIRHAVLLSFRNFKRYKSSFAINLISLSTGLAAALFIYLWVADELSYDKFHEKEGRLYQVMRNVSSDGTDVETYFNNSDLLAPAFKEEMPEVENIVPVSDDLVKGIMSFEEKKIKSEGRFAGEEFFNVFSYKLVLGNKDQVLKDKYSIVISTALAEDLFGSLDNAMGKTITLDTESYGGTFIVSGLFEKTDRSSYQFDFLGTYQFRLENNSMDVHWDSNSALVFLALRSDANADVFNAKIKNFVKDKFKAAYGTKGLEWAGQLFIRPYSDAYLFDHYVNGVQQGGRINYVVLFSIVGVFMLLIACINFMNLFTANATRRTKEVGIKKSIGASRNTLIFQYMSESMILSFLSLIIGLALVLLLLPRFNIITGKNLALHFDVNLTAAMLVIVIITGLVAGSYPALYLSGFKPLEVLKGKLNATFGQVVARKGLVMFQFALSLLLIVSVVVAYKQIEFIQSVNLGYNRNNVVTFEREGKLNESLDAFITQARNIPGVVNISNMGGDLVGNHSGGGGISWPGKTHRIEFSGLYVNFGLIETMNVQLAEGRSFSEQFRSDSTKVLFNETAIAAMQLKDPIGKTVNMWGNEKQIIGVVKDFHFESLYNKVAPFFFSYSNEGENIVVKLRAGLEKKTLVELEELYHKFNPGIAFDFRFVDQDYQRLYAAEQRVSDLSLYFSGIAIVISCLGLFGMATFISETRTKEIGIRKVLGSSDFGIVYLLSKEFLQNVLIALFVAAPISYLLSTQWLSTFAYRITLEWWYFAGAALVVLLVASITIGLQTLKSSQLNPTECLKSE